MILEKKVSRTCLGKCKKLMNAFKYAICSLVSYLSNCLLIIELFFGTVAGLEAATSWEFHWMFTSVLLRKTCEWMFSFITNVNNGNSLLHDLWLLSVPRPDCIGSSYRVRNNVSHFFNEIKLFKNETSLSSYNWFKMI